MGTLSLLPLALLLAASPDETAVRSLLFEFTHVENARNSARLSRILTEDAEVVVQGHLLAKGPAQIAAHLTARTPWSEFTGATYRIQQVEVSGERATVKAERTYFGANLHRSSACTFLLRKESGQWKVLSYRNLVLGHALPGDSPFR